MKVKQEDIAQKLGISRTTVARALNGNGSIKESVRQEVLQLADEMGYIKDTVGSTLATKKEKKIYIFLVKSLNKHYLQEIYKGLNKAKLEYKYLKFNFVYIETNITTPYKQAEILKNILSTEVVDGVIITPLIKNEIIDIVNLYKSKVSFLMLDSFLCDNVGFVGSNYYVNGQITANLIDKILRKNEKILLFNAVDDNISSIKYYNGFKNTIINSDKILIEVGEITKDGNNIFTLVKDYIKDNEVIAIYAPRFTNVLVDKLIAEGVNLGNIKIVAQSKGLEMEKYLENHNVVAIVEEMLEIVAYDTGKYMIENLYNNKPIEYIKAYIEPKIIISSTETY